MTKQEREKLREKANILLEDGLSILTGIYATELAALLDHIDALEEKNKELIGVLEPLLERCLNIEDQGPYGEGWKSKALLDEISAAEAAIASASEEKKS